jgi:stage II sporulation protein GA (sporulation sigma-E factor processing peptidase)
MVINTLLLWLTFRTIKQQTPWRLVIISATIGTAAALLMPLLTFGGIAMFFVKLFVGATMVFIVQYKSFVRFLLFYMIFLTFTFALGGALYGMLFMFTSTSGSLLYFTNNTSIPIGLLIIGVVIFGKILSLLVKYLNLRQSVNNHLRDVVIHYDGERYKVQSYLDTGNRLIDPRSRAPVVIITLSLFLKMFPEITPDKIVLNKLAASNINDGHYIQFSTVGSDKGKMFVFAPEKIEIVDNRKTKVHQEVRLGVSMKGFKDTIKYDALLNANLA